MIRIDDDGSGSTPALRLIDFVPESIAEEDDIVALSAALDPEIRLVAQAAIEANILPRIASQPEAVLDALAWAFRFNELRIWDLSSVDGKRAILRNIFDLRRRSGTRYTMRKLFELLEVTATIIEWFEEGAPEFSYRVRLLVDEVGIDLPKMLAIPEFTRRFEPARSKFRRFTVESERTAPLVQYPALTIGHLTEIGMP